MSIETYECTLRDINEHPSQLDRTALLLQYRSVVQETEFFGDHRYLAYKTMTYLGIEKVYLELLNHASVPSEVFENLIFSHAASTLSEDKILQLLRLTKMLRLDAFQSIMGSLITLHNVIKNHWVFLDPRPLPVPS